MKVKCINKDLHGMDLDYGFEPTDLIIGEIYNVYGLEIVGENVFVFVSDDPLSFYPSRYLIKYFEIISKRLSSYWRFNIAGKSVQFFIQDWINEPDFMRVYIDDLSDPSQPDYSPINSFYSVKELIDNENRRWELNFEE